MLVTSALTSLRGAAKSIEVFSDAYPGCIPAHTTIQNWVLQYGVYELLKPIEKREDWIFILDHTIEFGNQKCLLVLGLTLERFMKNDCVVKHEDMEVLRIEITTKTNSVRIYQTLTSLIRKTGVPIQIISDHGRDISKAVKDLCKRYQKLVYSYDITHKCALLLKHMLKNDERWHLFIKECSQTKRKILNSELGFLAPPNAKDKSRWLNFDLYVKWAGKILALRANACKKPRLLKKHKVFQEKFDSYFFWLNYFKEEVVEWQQIFSILNMARCEVKANGLGTSTVANFQDEANRVFAPSSRAQKLIIDLRMFLKEASNSVPSGEKWLGTSDIIESIFGKYKNFSSRSTMKGIGKIILTIPVFTSEITSGKIKTALETISNKKLKEWVHKNIGQSFFSKRQLLLGR